MNCQDIDWDSPIAINIMIDFGQEGKEEAEQPRLYGASKARYEAYRSGRFVGDTRLGGTCNFGDVMISPHLNGTHTECSGHITKERRFITDIDTVSPKLALLVTVETSTLGESGESYSGEQSSSDQVISASALMSAVNKDIALHKQAPQALIIRHLPNEAEKMHQDYSEYIAPYFTSEAINFINSFGFKHLMTDLPSVDRTDDGGGLANHHKYFGHVKDRESAPDFPDKTITELIYVPNEVEDGTYMLNMNVARWQLDAAPSYPVLFPIKKKA